MRTPEIHYARTSDGVTVAYQRWGTSGAPVFTWFPFLFGHLEVEWEEPHVVHSFRRLGSFADVIHFDKRGSGLSDRLEGAPTLEQRVLDVQAVLDAEEVDQAFIGGMSEGGPLALLFAALYPERVAGVVLINPAVPSGFGWLPARVRDMLATRMRTRMDRLVDGWGTAGSAGTELFAPSMVGHSGFEQWMQRFERMSCSPGQIRRLVDLAFEIDVTDILASVQVPVLVLHCARDMIVPFPLGRELARRLPDARFVSVNSRDHAFVVDDRATERIMAETEAFVTGEIRRPNATERALATVLFTDIVDSTGHAARLGDSRWREVLDLHDTASQEAVGRWQGRLVKLTGDGLLAVFDTPGRAIDCVLDLRHTVERFGLGLRGAVHTGEVDFRGDDIAGMAVHLASRMLGAAGDGEVVVSRTVKELVVGSDHRFAEYGVHEFAGVPDRHTVYRVADTVRA